jgi:hypothetical protein
MLCAPDKQMHTPLVPTEDLASTMYTSALFGVDDITQTSDADPALAPFIPDNTSLSSILCAVTDEQNINLI